MFSDELYRLWGSERAVAFNNVLTMLSELNVRIESVRYQILTSASKAASFMAQRNGATFNYDGNEGVPSSGLEFQKLEVSKDGIKGMNIPLVKVSVDTFYQSTSQMVEMLRDAPLSFSLLDPAGELREEYKRLVLSLIGGLENTIGYSIGQIKEALEEEELQITMGKEQAAQTLAG